MKETCPNCGHKVKPKKDGTCPDCGAEMKKAAEGDLQEGTLIESGDLAPISEAAQVIVPKKGKLLEDRKIEGGHTVQVAKFAIIRPCQSRGKSISGLQPIYEAEMLGKHAGVFTGWQMFLDHISEELAEAFGEVLQEKGRSWKELGGRVLKSWYDPTVQLAEDEQNGFQKGAVVGEIIPYPVVREILKADPLGIAVSINAWPTRARIGRPSWDATKKGAVIEGIRSKPQGSVDFVPRAGAGGRFLTESSTPEEIRSAVSLLESAYTAARDDEHPDRKERPVTKKLSQLTEEEIAKLTPEQLAEALREENPQLAESLSEGIIGTNAGNGNGEKPLTQADLDRALSEQRQALVEEFGGSRETAEELAEEMVQEREELRSLHGVAEKRIAEAEKNGLPKSFADEIRKNYMLLPSGPRAGIVVEGEQQDGEGNTLTAEQVVEARVRADVATAVKLIEDAGGKAPRIEGLGPSGKKPPEDGGGAQEERKVLREGSAFGDFLRESGDLTGDPEKDAKKIREMVEG